ncbi:MAG TPA: HAD-IIIC family phosphatase [Methylomirabilota bacterium]|jgi:FkbH-like protein
MSTLLNPVQRALAAKTRAELVDALRPARPSVSLPDIQRLTAHLEKLAEATVSLRIAILHTYTTDLLDPYIRFEGLAQGLDAATYHGPYGAIMQEATPTSGLVAHEPDLTVILLRWEDLDPALGTAFTAHAAELADLTERASRRLLDQIEAVRAAVGGHLLVSLLPIDREPGLGDYDATAPSSEHRWREGFKDHIATSLRTRIASATLLDLDQSLAVIGRERFFDRRWWYTSRFPFSPAAAQDVVRRIVAVGAVLKRPRAKVIVLDADNTLWGGVVGEDGIEGIALGPDYPGNCYVAFQRRVLEYQQRGFILALCSKNNEADVLEVLRRHPHQVLREEHFAGLRINWQDKPQNLQALAEELNLGLDSFVFVDDSAHECSVVRHTLPTIEVVQTPGRAIDVPTCLDRVSRLEIVALTEEDRRKSEMYVQERRRRAMATASVDLSSYLKSLAMEMAVAFNDARQTVRVAQLTQKTNQFNLTTRRYSEDQIQRFVEADDCLVAHFSLRDIFGDSGLVGLAVVRLTSPEVAELDTFLMSCRVVGRKAETAFLETILEELRRRGVAALVADYLPTGKNALVATFLADHQFVSRPDGRHQRDLDAPIRRNLDEVPIAVRIVDAPVAVSA